MTDARRRRPNSRRVHIDNLCRPARELLREVRQNRDRDPMYRYGRILQAMSPHIRKLVIALGVQRVDADDVTQDVVVGSLTSINAGRFDHNYGNRGAAKNLAAWLYVIARNLVNHYAQAMWRKRERLTPDPAVIADTLGQNVCTDGALEFLDALSRIPRDLRCAIIDYVNLGADGMAHAESVTPRAINNRVSTAKQALREALGSLTE